jgi:LDH2 family malate/lactate/ureidoglycolate dehydrogenase
MSVYPGSENERRFAFDALCQATSEIFVACGMSDEDAQLLGTSLAHADLHGVHSHGVMRVPDYVGRMSAPKKPGDRSSIAGVLGGVNPCGVPRLTRDRGAALVVDGDNSMGQIGGMFAMQSAIERAKTTGVAFAAVGNSNHCGALFWFVQHAIEAGMIGIASTNALPTMAPWGGIDRIVGMNPLAVGIPTGNEPSFVMDAAFAACARGKVVVYHQKGEPIPDNWALDAQGQPTTDAGAALQGLLRPVGDYKGVNVSMAMGVLSTLLSGAGYGTRLGSVDEGPKAGRDGHFMMAMDIDAFCDANDFRDEMDAVIDEIHTSRRAPGVERIYSAGELEAETATSYQRDGIPLNDETLAELENTASSLGVALTL